jgi:alkylation response protein AidB-like acyl-CoA dehydrogenase
MTTTADPVSTDRSHLEVIKELAADFATRSDQHDRDGTYPYENIEALKKAGHARMMLPKEYGGMGTSLPEMAHVMRALGKGDGPTALIVTQHHAVVANYSLQGLLHGNERLARFAREEFANDKWIGLFAGQPEFEERAPATATRVDGGFLLNGRKGFGTSSRTADFGTGPFLWQKSPEEQANVTVIYRTSDPGFRIVENSWDTFGMRSTQSNDLEFTDLFVPDEDVVRITPIGGPGFGADNLSQNFFGFGLIMFAALYLGIADAAFDKAKQILAERKPVGGGPAAITNPGLQSFLGEIDQKIREAGAMLNWTVWVNREPANWGSNAFPDIVAMKDSVTRKAVEITEMCMQAVGGPAYYRRSGLERLYRDVRGGPIHPFNHPAAMSLLGRMAVPPADS